MCQANLARIIELVDGGAIAEVKGKRRKILTDLVDVGPGDYVLCSLDLAIERVDPEEARQMIT
jgi:hydrogenase maturation factor